VGESSRAEPERRRLVVGDDTDWHDPRRFELLVDVHGRRVHAYLSRRAPADADDLLAEVWLAAFEARHRFDPRRGDPGAWLFGIARNVLLAHFRGVRRRAGLVERRAPEHDESAAVDDRLDAAGAAAGLRSALAAMPVDEREVLLLVAWEDLSPSEAAEVLGIPAGTARSRLHRARSRLLAAAPTDTEEPEREAVS
jgi:RNA polymerase sigma-70 factor (ECF subfamily)